MCLRFCTLLLVVFFLSACGPSAEQVASQIEQTVEARPPVEQTVISEVEVTRVVEVELEVL